MIGRCCRTRHSYYNSAILIVMIVTFVIANLIVQHTAAQQQRQHLRRLPWQDDELEAALAPSYSGLPPPLGFGSTPDLYRRIKKPLSYQAPSVSQFEEIADAEMDTNYPTKEYNAIGIDRSSSKKYNEPVPNRCFASTITTDPATIEPQFVVIKPGSETRVNASISLLDIGSTGFDPRQQTVLLVHGFTQSYPETEWLRRVRALFEVHKQLGRYNLVIMDWKAAAASPYPRAAALTSVVGTYLADFIAKLLNLGADRRSFHLIAHSLGAHVAGFAGKLTKPRIGRITALDSAGPCFGKLYSNGQSEQLSADDAIEVDVYHYDDQFLGLSGQHGQFDVYVNGGSSQPGATDNFNTMIGALVTLVFRRKRVLSESHSRSIQVAMTNLDKEGEQQCQMVAFECKDYASFLNGECGFCDERNNQCYIMSFAYQYSEPLATRIELQSLRTSFPGKRLYISTKGDPSYCQFHDQILVRLEPRADALREAAQNGWQLHLQLFDDANSETQIKLTNLMTANVFSYLLLSETRRRRFVAARLQIKSYDGSFVTLQQPSQQQYALQNAGSQQSSVLPNKLDVKVFAIDINYMSNIDANLRRSMSSRLCPAPTSSSSAYSYKDNLVNAGNGSDGDMPSSKYQLLFSECFAP